MNICHEGKKMKVYALQFTHFKVNWAAHYKEEYDNDEYKCIVWAMVIMTEI